MEELKDIVTIYFIGIGGIGMSALARYFVKHGKFVCGYDRTPSEITDSLMKEGIEILFEDVILDLPKQVSDKERTLVVYTPAVPDSNKIITWFRDNNYSIHKRAEILGTITKNKTCLAVAGTHGKTTTSAILSHLLMDCNMSVTALIGGIAENYNSNYISNGDDIMIVEADEFDRSFLHLDPDIACITTMDADHLDIYEDTDSVESSFKEFSESVSNKDHLLIKKGLPLEGMTVSIEDSSDYEAQNIRLDDGSYIFDLMTPRELLKDLRLSMPGRHNMYNAVIALGMAILAGTPTSCLPKALSSFKGVKRRFSYKIKNEETVLIDDYAHHPTEINALFQAVTELFPNDDKLIVFQPHLFSRTRDFIDGFAESLSQFDEVLLMDIYPARELPIPGVTISWLFDKISHDKKQITNRRKLAHDMERSTCRIKLMVGAGDIGEEVQRITNYLTV
jgi:UDP-N-acetylmuramate--alanine ligase